MSRLYTPSTRWGTINTLHVYTNHVTIIMLLIARIFIGHVILDMFDDYLTVY